MIISFKSGSTIAIFKNDEDTHTSYVDIYADSNVASGPTSGASVDYTNYSSNIYETEIDVPEENEPHKVKNHYLPAPIKLEFKSYAPKFIYKRFKQPISKSGFKRGQRNDL